ncbi:MAG: hypothetical protein ACJ71H_14630 [Nitrososphaeraceae archaeon]
MTSIIPLLVVIIMIIITANTEIITYYAINSSHSAYAHNFVPALAATFLTKINQIRVQTQLVENDIPLNLSLAKQHAEIASELFDNNTQNDLYYNAEGNNGLAKTISDDIPLALNNLQKAVRTISTTAASNQSEQPQQQTTTSSSVIKEIKQMVNNINYILDKAIYVRIGKSDLTNSTVHALVLADITEKAYNDYSYAFGIKPVIFSGSSSSSMMMNMSSGMGMGTMMMGSSPNSSSSTNSSAKNDLPMTKDNNDNSTVVNTTAYQQAQGLAMRAQQMFNNDLKPTSSVNGPSSSSSTNSSPSSTNTTITTAITKIENSLIHLKNAIDGKAPTMDVMKIVHGEIHPVLLISYKLQLKGANNDNEVSNSYD